MLIIGHIAFLNRKATELKIKYIHEPTDLQCGQAVLAMALNKTVDEIIGYLGNERETTLKEIKTAFREFGVEISDERREVNKKSELPEMCLLSLETPRCWHWSLFCDGFFYDPEHGVLEDFPQSERRYYWKLKKIFENT